MSPKPTLKPSERHHEHHSTLPHSVSAWQLPPTRDTLHRPELPGLHRHVQRAEEPGHLRRSSTRPRASARAGTGGRSEEPVVPGRASQRKFLYAVSEISDLDGKPAGGVSAFAIDRATGKLRRSMSNRRAARARATWWSTRAGKRCWWPTTAAAAWPRCRSGSDGKLAGGVVHPARRAALPARGKGVRTPTRSTWTRPIVCRGGRPGPGQGAGL